MVSSGDLSDSPKLPVWQPLTFGGVVAFARGRWTRLVAVQMVVAVFVAVTVVVILSRCWFPVVTQATKELTDFGAVRGAQLAWPKKEAAVLAENHFIGLVVDLEDVGGTGQIADLQIEFTRERIKLVSLLGFTSFPYPGGVEIELSHPALDPWWNAWRPAFLFGGAFATILWLFASWFALATLYTLPVRVLAWFGGRDTSLGKCWRVSAAALLPGAVWLGGAQLLYAAGQMSLVGLGVAFGLHFVIAWVYLLGAPFCLPRNGDDLLATGGNPFTPAAVVEKKEAPTPPSASSNPFQSGSRD